MTDQQLPSAVDVLIEAIKKKGTSFIFQELQRRNCQVQIVYGPCRGFDAWMYSVQIAPQHTIEAFLSGVMMTPIAAETLEKALAIAIIETESYAP